MAYVALCYTIEHGFSQRQRPNNDQISGPLLPETHGESVGQSITCTGLRSLESVGINVQCGGGLGVAQHGRNGPHILAVVNQQRCIQMPELVDTVEGQILFPAEFLQPLVGLLQTDGRSVLLGEETIAFVPLIAQGQPVEGLLCSELFNQVEDPRRKLQRAAALGRLGGSRKNAVLGRIE